MEVLDEHQVSKAQETSQEITTLSGGERAEMVPAAGAEPAGVWAARYVARGWAPVPIPHGQKGPTTSGWQKLLIGPDQVAAYFPAGETKNIGLLLGEPSGGLVDVDLDAPEARDLAAAHLPATGLKGGRTGNPGSHWWFQVNRDDARKTIRHEDVAKGGVLVEFRSTGGQTVVAPSQHPSGGTYAWSEFGEPAKVKTGVLVAAVARLAAAALLARHWPRDFHKGEVLYLALQKELTGFKGRDAVAALLNPVIEYVYGKETAGHLLAGIRANTTLEPAEWGLDYPLGDKAAAVVARVRQLLGFPTVAPTIAAAKGPAETTPPAESPDCCGDCPGGKLLARVTPDSEYDQRIRKLLESILDRWPSIEKRWGSKTLAFVAVRLTRGYCLAEEAALGYLRDWNQENARRHQTTAWTDKQMERAVRNMIAKGRKPWGFLIQDSKPKKTAPAAPPPPVVQAPPVETTLEDPLLLRFKEQFERSPSFTLPTPMPIDKFVQHAAAMPVYIVEDLIPYSSKVLLAGREKAGKTTWLAHLLAALSRRQQEFMGFRLGAEPVKVLIVTQEPELVWAVRQADHKYDRELVHFQGGRDGLPAPYIPKPSLQKWEDTCFGLAQHVIAHGYKIVVIDHLSRFWSVRNERDDGEVEAAWAPVELIVQAGASVVALHHGNKYGGIRGSTAIPAAADHVLHFRQLNLNPLETRRTVVVGSRIARTTFELMLNLDFSKNAPVGEYALLTDSRKLNENDVVAQILKKLPTWPPVFWEALANDMNIPGTTFRRHLKKLPKDQGCRAKCGNKMVWWKPTGDHPCADKLDDC
jgi:hypothetical protein